MRDDQRANARIMVVDDEPQNVRYVTDVLQWAGYETLEGLTDPVEAVNRFGDFDPDLVILDLLMPGMDGFEVMDAMREHVPDDVYLPFLILTSDITSESRRRALSGGARDFLTKPMSPTEVRLRVDNLLQTRFLYLECARQANLLGAEKTAATDAGDLDDASIHEIVERWGASLDLALGHGEGRSKRVGWLATRIAEGLDLEEGVADRVRAAAYLCDLGTTRVGDVIRTQPGTGAALLEGTVNPVLAHVREVLTALDEHFDGSGSGGLRGEAIPIEARVASVALAFEDFQNGGLSSADAISKIDALAGTRFDPGVVAALSHAQAVGA